jgi:hypothetical protein
MQFADYVLQCVNAMTIDVDYVIIVYCILIAVLIHGHLVPAVVCTMQQPISF